MSDRLPRDLRAAVCRLAACREDLGDGKEWSLFVLNDTDAPIDVALQRVAYEWGDRGHSAAPGLRVVVAARSAERLWREGWEGAEMNMELGLEVESSGTRTRLAFELGKLYRRRNPVPIAGIDLPGWLVPPTA